MAFLLSKDAKAFYGTAGTTAASALANIKNLTLTLNRDEADVTTRVNAGWKATAPTLRECTVEFEMVWDPTDAGFTAIQTAFLSDSGLIALLVLDKTGGQGIDGDFAITGFSRSEQLTEAITVSVSAKLSVFREWEAGT